MLGLKKDRQHIEEAASLGNAFVRYYKEDIIKEVEALTGKNREEIKYITIHTFFSWEERTTTIIRLYESTIYYHKSCSIDDQVDDIFEPPNPDMLKELNIRKDNKPVSVTVRFF